MKVATDITKTHNPFDEDYWASCLRENLTSSSYGEGLETGREYTQEPRQSFTRQLFFKWIKQHLRIKAFYGTSENAVKSQIWIAISVYVLVAIIKKRLIIEQSLYTILQILSVSIFEKMPIYQVLTNTFYENEITPYYKQLSLFDI
jgi:hypothetical protein